MFLGRTSPKMSHQLQVRLKGPDSAPPKSNGPKVYSSSSSVKNLWVFLQKDSDLNPPRSRLHFEVPCTTHVLRKSVPGPVSQSQFVTADSNRSTKAVVELLFESQGRDPKETDSGSSKHPSRYAGERPHPVISVECKPLCWVGCMNL